MTEYMECDFILSFDCQVNVGRGSQARFVQPIPIVESDNEQIELLMLEVDKFLTKMQSPKVKHC